MKRSLEILDEKLEYEPAQPFWRTHPKLQERIATADELLKNGSSNLPRAANPSGVIVGHAIVRAGGTVAGDMSAEALQRDDETRQVAVRLRKKYDSIGVQMLKKPGGVEKGRYTLGDEVALLPCARQADALAFVDGRILLQTPGRKAFNVLAANIGGLLALRSRYDIWLSLVDAKTGQVIAFIHEVGTEGKTDAERDESFSQAFSGQLQKVHVGWVRPAASTK